MYEIVERRPTWYLISAILIVPSILFMIWSLFTNGTILPLSIDFTGGTLWEMRFQQAVAPADIRQVFVEAGYTDTSAFTVDDENTLQVKFKSIDIDTKETLIGQIEQRIGPFEERYYRSIGPAIGSEVSQAALLAVIVASVGILLYIAWAFKQVPHPFRYGACAVAALVHDVLVSISFMGIMYLVAGWEADALFLTAILTVIGFSVNDTIVIFDRIRENLKRYRGERLATVANRSVLETLQRSLGTQVTVVFVLASILIFGGASLRQFMSVMMVGMISGSYSTIFFATPLLVAWDERSWFGGRRRQPAPVTDGTPAAA